ncbi:MAG TPA: methyltransferase [Nannocystaceae bacterium]|nr:methyltransferase [Nannocystaceae bacterium]
MNTDDPEPLVTLGLSFWRAKAVMTAVDTGVFAALAKGACDATTLCTRLGFHGRGASDLFDVLVALGLLARADGRYANTPMAARYLDPAQPEYIGGLFELGERRLYPVWTKLGAALRSGTPQNEASAQDDYYGELSRDDDRLRVFLGGMTGLSAAAARHIAQRSFWADYRTFLDLGGAEGGTSVQLALAHPQLSGGSFDLPPIEPYFDRYVARFGLGERLRFFAGDFFDGPLPCADALVMGHVLHNWGLDDKRTLLAKAYDALPSGGVLVIHEVLIDDPRRDHAAAMLMSLNMLLVTREGFGFTGAQCREWLTETGFRNVRVEHLAGAEWMIVGFK